MGSKRKVKKPNPKNKTRIIGFRPSDETVVKLKAVMRHMKSQCIDANLSDAVSFCIHQAFEKMKGRGK